MKANNFKCRSKLRGVGLIEVLISVLIFALGLASLLKMQGLLLKASGLAQARSAAVEIAEAKIEDLRSFTAYQSSPAATTDFTSIANNAGGALVATGANCTDDSTTARTLTVGSTSFSRNWCVTNYYYTSAIPAVLTTTPPTGALIAQKAITVRVGWSDSDGVNQLLTYNVVINMNGSLSGGSMAFNSGGSGEQPVVPHTGSTDDRVTPIGVGTDTKRETLVPGSTTVDGYVSTAFQSHVYNNSNELIRTEEFKNVACTCAFDGTSTDADQTRAPSYPKWSNARSTYLDVTGPLVTGKAKGCVDNNENGSCDANPNIYCEICCRDHHDVPSSNTTVDRKVYDPYRVGDVTDGVANKYRGTSTAVTSGTYYDACRLKRIDGYWRVYQDWNSVNFLLLPLADLTDASKKATYAAHVKDVLDAIIDSGTNATDGSSVTLPSLPATLDHTTSSNRVSLTVGEKADSSARAIYVDYIDSDFLTQIRNKKAAGQDYLLHFPFYEIDATSVAAWQSSVGTSVRVGPYDGPGSSNDLNAGQIHGILSHNSPVAIAANMRKSNSGLTSLSVSVDYNATTNPDTLTQTSQYDVCIGCTGGSTGASCSGAVGGLLLDGASRVVYPTSSGTCTAGSILCTNGVLSGDTGYSFTSCAATGATCTTSITVSTNNQDYTITATDGATTVACPYSNTSSGRRYYICPGLTHGTGSTLSVTSVRTSNNATSTSILTSTCGAQSISM